MISGTRQARPCRRLPAALIIAAFLFGISAVWAQSSRGEGDDAGMNMGAMQGGSAPPNARDPHAYAEGVDFTRGSRRPRMLDERVLTSMLFDNFEITRADGDTFMPYDLEAWFGGTYNRAVFKAEGDIDPGETVEGRTELLWGHAFAPYWDMQLGVRHDSGEGPNRNWFALGIEGLAPYWFDLEITGYLGESARTALRIDASYDVLITQKLVLQPRLEANFFGKRDARRGLGSGLTELSTQLRLRYEFRRELAPYIGLEWVNQFSGTEDRTRAADGDPHEIRVVAGFRFWY